ncbi:MAG: DUF4136 domain-containing protein [Chitinophagaceae bacterium]
MNYRKASPLFVVMAILMAFATVGCGTTAHVEKDESVNFTKYKTYSWVSDKEKSLKDRNSNNLVDNHVKSAVARELQKNGWTESKSHPEVLLDYNIMVENNVKESNNPVYTRSFTRYFYNPATRRISGLYYPSQIMGYERLEIPYKEGTITIHMIDNHTNKLIWQGWASEEVNNRNLTGREINSTVKSILKKFTPSRS